MAFLSAAEAASFFETSVPFLRGKFLWFVIYVNVHSIGVPGGSVHSGGGSMECDRGSRRMLLGNRSREASLAKELVYFLIPSFGCGGDYLHPVDSV